MTAPAPTQESRPSEATYPVVFTWTGYLQDFPDEPDTEALFHKILSQPLQGQKLDGKDIMEIAMLHPVWCHRVDPRLFLDPNPAESRLGFHQILSQRLRGKRLEVDDFAIVRILGPEPCSPGADGSPPSSTLVDNTNTITQLPEQTLLSPVFFLEERTTTPTTTQSDFTTSFNTEFRELQAENSNLKAEVEELKQKDSNLEIDVKSLQRVVFRGA
jgi:hypothetical protein